MDDQGGPDCQLSVTADPDVKISAADRKVWFDTTMERQQLQNQTRDQTLAPDVKQSLDASRLRSMTTSALALAYLVQEELLQGLIGQTEGGRLFHRLVDVPAIHDRAFHEPHPGGSSPPAQWMNAGATPAW